MGMTANWYIVHTYSNFEKKAAEEIKRQAQIQGLNDLIAWYQSHRPWWEAILQRSKTYRSYYAKQYTRRAK